MKITDNSDNIQCDNPIEITIDDQKGFIVIDSAFNVLFKSNVEIPLKCGEYVLLKVTNPVHNTENCDSLVDPPEDVCDKVITFLPNPQKTRVGNNTIFEISISGAGLSVVQFKSVLEDWKNATISNNGVTISAPSTGQATTIQARLQGCTTVITQSFTTLAPVEVPVPPAEPEEIEIATINFGTVHSLIVKTIQGEKWFLQTDSTRSYYLERGLNLLQDSRVTIIRDYNLSLLENEPVTPLGGLFATSTLNAQNSANWPTSWWTTNGYVINEAGEWLLASEQETCTETTWTDLGPTRCQSNVSQKYQKSNCNTYRWVAGGTACNQVPSGNVQNLLVLSPEETQKNWISWENFQNKQVNLPAGMDAVLGFGTPIYANDPAGQNGKHLALNIGYTHACNLTAYPKNLGRYAEENIYLFTQPFQLISNAARRMINMVNAGAFPTEYGSTYHNGGVWGNLELLAHPQDGTNYSGITLEGARKLGEYVFYERAWGLDPATAYGTPAYNINQSKAWYMLDDEQIPYGLGGIGKMSFLAAINKGMKTVAPLVKPVWYAVPMSFFFQTNQKADLITDQMIQNEILQGSLNYNLLDFKSTGYWFDSGVYVKVPTITSHDKYKKSNGQFIIDNQGKRLWNDATFTEVIYGETTTFLGAPDDGIKYLLYRTSDGATLLGPTFWDNVHSGSPTPKPEYLQQGYTSWGRPIPSDWKPETQLNTEFYYGFASVVMCNLIANARVEFNTTDVSLYKAEAKCLNYVELRLKTEEFTAGGNSIYSRQIGAGLLNFCQLFSYLSGIRAVSLWENGRDYGYGLPQRGQVMYPITDPGSIQNLLDNYSGLTHRTDGLNQLARDLANTNQADWRYIHFTYPVAIQNRQGVIGSGIYTGQKFVFMLINPTLNYDETQVVTLKIAGTSYEITLNGNGSPFYSVIPNLNAGLTNNDFSLEYTTIYGRFMKVSGKVNGQLNESILTGL